MKLIIQIPCYNEAEKSMLTIIRAYIMYKPLKFFTLVGAIPFLGGVAIGIRFLVYACMGNSNGHVQSLILAAILILIGFMTFIIGLQADIIAANRKILEDVQYHVRKLDYDADKKE